MGGGRVPDPLYGATFIVNADFFAVPQQTLPSLGAMGTFFFKILAQQFK